MKNARLCREADADVLGYWAEECWDLAPGAMGWILQGGQGSHGGCFFLQEVVESLGAALLCLKPLSQSPRVLEGGLTAARAAPRPRFYHLLVSKGR